MKRRIRRIRRIRRALKRAGLYNAFHIALIAVLLTGFCVILFNVKEPEQQEEKPHIKRVRAVLQKLGIIGENGASDIITLVDYMIGQGPETGKFTVSELCSRFSPNNAKSMEQRIRRAVNAGLTNLANMGLEDYSNDTFQDLAGSLYSFEQIRREMDFIRGKSEVHGKVSLKSFLNSLIFYCAN